MVIDKLIYEIKQAAQYNSDVQVAPKVILWPDGERLWEASIDILKEKLPELLVLGKYAPEQKTGPAIWLACILDNTLEEQILPKGVTPIIYMPGISRTQFRNVGELPKALHCIADLQFRGCYFSQESGKDWTPLAFLSSKGQGLNMEIKRDSDTKTTLLKALPSILRKQQSELKNKTLNQELLLQILTPDPERMLLGWFSDENKYKETLSETEWESFCQSMKLNYGFSPDKDGIIHAARLFSEAQNNWASVWQRYTESYSTFPGIYGLLERAPKENDMFANAATHGNCPVWNKSEESKLKDALDKLNGAERATAIKAIKQLIAEHKDRKALIWFNMGKSPYLKSLLEIEKAIQLMEKSFPTSTIETMATAYYDWAWQVDIHIQQAILPFKTDSEVATIKGVILAIYTDWLNNINTPFQAAVSKEGYPKNDAKVLTVPSQKSALVFVDGLRLDWAKLLNQKLLESGIQTNETLVWSVLPSITSSGKAYVSPLKDALSTETVKNTDFVPYFKGEDKKGSWANIKTQLKHIDWSTKLKGDKNLWIESGDIDHEGHHRGWKLPHQMETILSDITSQVQNLLEQGIENIKIVTDHGWLYLPGGLPKQELPAYLTDSKWGRCALIKETAPSDEAVYSWYWNPNVYFAAPRGISCYKAGQEYTHGGVSLQECLTLCLSISNQNSQKKQTASIDKIEWSGMRCKVLANASETTLLDIREQPADATTSITTKSKKVTVNKQVSLLVEDEDLEGEKAFVVLIDEQGNLLAQTETIIGG
jgi:hypothetical protein